MPLQDRHDIFSKLLSAERLSVRHEAGQVTGGLPFGESVFECGGYQPAGLIPSHIFEHHDGREQKRAGIHDVFAGDVRCRPMCRFEDRIAAVVVDVGSRCDTDTANHSRQLVGDIITIEIQRGNHRIFFRHKEGVLKEGVGNHIFDDDLSGSFGIQQSGSGGILSFSF